MDSRLVLSLAVVTFCPAVPEFFFAMFKMKTDLMLNTKYKKHVTTNFFKSSFALFCWASLCIYFRSGFRLHLYHVDFTVCVRFPIFHVLLNLCRSLFIKISFQMPSETSVTVSDIRWTGFERPCIVSWLFWTSMLCLSKQLPLSALKGTRDQRMRHFHQWDKARCCQGADFLHEHCLQGRCSEKRAEPTQKAFTSLYFLWWSRRVVTSSIHWDRKQTHRFETQFLMEQGMISIRKADY